MKIENLKEINPEDFVLMPEDFAIKSKIDNKIYTTTKDYIGKLFTDLGYKNLQEVETLIKYGVPVKTELKLKTLSVYIDSSTKEFICITPETYKWLNEVLPIFEKMNTVLSDLTGELKPVNQIIYSDNNIQYVLYINFKKETFEMYGMSNYMTMTKLHKASMKKDTGDKDIIEDTVNNIDLYLDTATAKTHSYDTAIKVLETAGIIKKKGNMYITDNPNQKIFSSQITVDDFLEKNFSGNSQYEVEHSDLCAIILDAVLNKQIPVKDFLFFYTIY